MFFAKPPPHLQDKPVVCSKQATVMLCTSGVCAIAAAYGIYKGHYLSSLIPAAIFITSMNYWRHPIYGWRRTLDVACVVFSFITMLIIAYHATYGTGYYIFITLAAVCYPLSHYFHNQDQQYMGTLMHAYMHIFGNIALFVIFSGDILHLSNIPWLTEASTMP